MRRWGAGMGRAELAAWQQEKKKQSPKSHMVSEGLCMGTKASERTFAMSLRHTLSAFWGLDTYLRYKLPFLRRLLGWGGGRWLLGSGWNNFSCGRQLQMYFRLRSPEGPLFQLTACSLRLVLKWCLYILIQLLSDHIYCKCCPAIICKRSIIYFYAPNRKYKSKVQSSTNNLFYRTAFLRAGPLLHKCLFFQSVL